MSVIDIVQGFYQPIRHTLKKSVFANMAPNMSIGDLVTEEGDYIKINRRPFGKPVAIKLLGSPKKVDAMFKVFSWFGGVSFHKFFTFEFICMLEEIRLGRFKYDVDMEVVEKCLEHFLGDMRTFQEVHDIDRKRIRELFNVEPLEHQNEMIAKYMQYKYIQKYRGMLTHAAAGTGKSAFSLFVMEGLHKEVKNVIILCPLPTVNDVWKKTLGEDKNIFKKAQDYWFVLDKEDYKGQKYIICHYEGLEKIMSMKLPKQTTALIIDECHNLNDPKSKRSQLAIELANKFDMQNILMLSGTPIKSGFRELGLLFKFLDRNFTKEAEKRYLTLYASATEFLTKVLYERYDGYTVKVTKEAIKLEPLTTINLKVNIPEKELEKYYLANIKEQLKEFVARRAKELKEQEGYWSEVYLRLREKAKDASGIDAFSYGTYVKDVDSIRKANKFQYGQMSDLLERVNKFEKEKLMPALVGEDRHLFREAKTIFKYPELKIQGEALAHIIGRARINCHILLAEYLDFQAIISASKKKTIIFSNYTDVCKAAEQICSNLGYNPICVFGEETKNLASNVDKFLNSKNINPLITTYKSLSTGVPLTAADTIICLDMPFRMYVYEQAVARAWRLGQDSQVFSYIVEANTDVPNINSRNIDIISWYKEEVEKITGVSSSVGLKGDSLETGQGEVEEDFDMSDVKKEEFNLSIEDLNISTEATNPKRQAVQDFIIKYIGKIVTGNQNVELYKNMFKNMNDKEFEEFMIKLRDGKLHLSIIVPHGMKDIKTNVENNIKIAKELGYDFYQRLHISGSNNMPDYITPNKYLVIKLPVRRASQLLSKKVSIPQDNKSRDLLTGQVTNKSRAAKLTNPEVQILLGLGLDNSIKELMKFRGGDLGAGNAMNNDMMRYGRATQANAAQYSTGVVSTKTLKQFFQAMHVRSTL